MYYVKNNRNIYFLIGDMLSVLFAILFNAFIFRAELSGLIKTLPIGLFSTVLLTVMIHSYEDVLIRGKLVELKETTYSSIKVVLIFAFVSTYFYHVVIKQTAIISLFFTTLFVMYLVRLVGKKIYLNFRNAQRKVIVISDLAHVDLILDHLNKEEEVIGIISKANQSSYRNIPIVNHLNDITTFLTTTNVDEVFVNVGEFTTNEIVKWTNRIGITTNINLTPIIHHINGNYIFTRQNDNIYLTSSLNIARLYQVVLKRVMDIFFGLIGLALMCIALLFVIPIVKIQSPGPIFFKQKRIGKNGKVFNMYKFRSMYLDAEERKQELMKDNELDSNLMFKIKDDPRIFPFGKIMRKLSIDELPQFINVLKGEMSLVGTRPPTLDEWVQYEPQHFKRLFIKPGITGLWQVSGRSNIKNFDDVVRLDMEYIESWRILLDIKIILKTIKVILKREGSS